MLASTLLAAGPVSGASAGGTGGDARAAAAAMKARAAAPARARANEVVVSDTRGSRVVKVRDVAKASRAIAKRDGVRSVTPNYIAHVSGWVPPDPGNAAAPGGWQSLQWNFLADSGVNAPEAWANLARVGRPGGKGVIVAVLDTGVAYANRGGFRRSPDLSKSRFVRGWDFANNDPYPNDDNGHGTHVASTIVEGTGNAIGLTGLAYGVKVMPVKVLDAEGEGDSGRIAAGIRFAADRGAQVINLSFEFPSDITRSQIPNILNAIRHARRKGALVVGASGNAAAAAVAYPARSSDVLSVGATTQHGCQADYSNEGADLDIVAPGGGVDAALEGDPLCRPLEAAGLDIFQMTFTSSPRRFGLPDGYIGTSMAAPHASATAALIIASGVLGPKPTPNAIERRLELTATDLGPAGKDPHYGWGRINAARATDPAIPVT
ncbi:S8 family serine peptidase [Solirubrobacter pauli]|uniref:S8 family serine peptidase n=1 Tax=Solirubrobacter pauli TaxID=166793 RepID=UPI0014771EFB|nr:S8 family serine peptidase [Solirubrobacter pauli]